jgi:putative copper resistance protein D
VGIDALLAHGVGGPPPLTVTTALTQWELDPVLVALLLIFAGLYLAGVRRLAANGVHWSVWRSVSYLGGGIGTIAIATQSSLGAYDGTLFSMHVVQHIILGMVSPIFLALGAPITLALRALSGRPRRVLLSVLHSWVARVVSSPLFGLPFFVSALAAVYFTGLYELQLEHNGLHELIHVWFITGGCVLFWPIIGVDPLPNRLSYPMRTLVAFTALPVHAFVGLILMQSAQQNSSLIALDYYTRLNRDWGPSIASDQNWGGGLMWAWGDLTAVILVAALVVQWIRADEREARRVDRHLDRLEAQQAAAAARAESGAPPR